MVPHAAGLVDTEFQIHCLEIEAYGAVLRAFIAQSDVLSWGKEGLISELRKDLRVSDVEHREILAKVNSDESIKKMRESHKGSGIQQGNVSNITDSFAFPSSSMVNVPRKRPKITAMVSPPYPSRSQPPSATLPSQLMTNMKKDPRDSTGTIFSPYPSFGQTTESLSQHHNRQGRSSFMIKIPRKGLGQAGFDTSIPNYDTIEILETNILLDEIESVCGVENPDPAKIEQAKLILKDHERALLQALSKLGDVSEGGY